MNGGNHQKSITNECVVHQPEGWSETSASVSADKIDLFECCNTFTTGTCKQCPQSLSKHIKNQNNHKVRKIDALH